MRVLNGKTAVVTGAASGIGLALAQRFTEESMNVVLADVEEAALDRAVAQLAETGASVMGVVTDVSRAESVDALAVKAKERFGTVHIVCNNAGVGGHHYPIWEVPLSYREWVLSVNLRGVIHGNRSFVPILLDQREGHIVNTASVAGLVAIPYIGPYVATKHAIIAISTTLFHELAALASAVKVSVLCPGAVDTRLADADRNWPSRLGAPPTTSEDPRAQSVHEVVRSGVRMGLPPTRVAQLVIDAIYAERFMVLTDSAFATQAITSFTEAVEGRPPVMPRLG